MKAPIIYYGGKTSMLPVILPLIPEHEVYTESFFGGGAVFWAKSQVKNETINDRLDIVVNFYRQLKNNFAALKKEIDATVFSRSQHDYALVIIRSPLNFSAVDRAWAFWMASNFSYGNKIGGGIKFSNDQGVLPPRVMTNMKARFTEMLVHRIENVHIENRDALQILKSRNVPNAFHFIDSPYPNADQGHYRGYTFQHFERLLQQAEQLEGKFILCNYASKMLDDYVKKNGWHKQEFSYNMKGMRKHNQVKKEILVMNYHPVITNELNFQENLNHAGSGYR